MSLLMEEGSRGRSVLFLRLPNVVRNFCRNKSNRKADKLARVEVET